MTFYWGFVWLFLEILNDEVVYKVGVSMTWDLYDTRITFVLKTICKVNNKVISTLKSVITHKMIKEWVTYTFALNYGKDHVMYGHTRLIDDLNSNRDSYITCIWLYNNMVRLSEPILVVIDL